MSRLYLDFFYCHSITEMLLWGLLLVILWMLFAIFSNWNNKTKEWIWMNRVLLAATVIFVLYWTVGKRNGSGEREASLIPFYSLFAGIEQPERFRSLVANILLFVPVGLAGPFVFDSIHLCRPVQYTIIVGMALSVWIESLQYLFSLGLFETDDIIFNTLGTATGCLAYVIARAVERSG